MTFFCCCNQVVAFVLEAFFAEMDLESPEKSEEQDKVLEFLKFDFAIKKNCTVMTI